jgi:hypothetical protein
MRSIAAPRRNPTVASVRARASGRVALALVAAAVVSAVASAVVVAGCGESSASGRPTPPGRLPLRNETVRLDPANFTTRIDNPYLPMAPGSRWVYRDTEGGVVHRVVIEVTPQTKVVDGIVARVVHDVEMQGAEVIENTFDWFAQDRAGNVWYLGEATRAYDNGKPGSGKGSWEAGKSGAQAGIAMPAAPRPGLEYRQEYREDTAEDAARVLSVAEQVQAPEGHHGNALLTKEFTPIEPKDVEYKLYARGVGLVLAVGVSGNASRQELLSYEKGGG